MAGTGGEHIALSLLRMLIPFPEPNRVAGGLKAAMKNPNVGEEAKERARERVEDMEESGQVTTNQNEPTGPLSGNQIGGYKATLKSESSLFQPSFQCLKQFIDPKVSQEAKDHAREVLDAQAENDDNEYMNN